jgi:hypothetical protein
MVALGTIALVWILVFLLVAMIEKWLLYSEKFPAWVHHALNNKKLRAPPQGSLCIIACLHFLLVRGSWETPREPAIPPIDSRAQSIARDRISPQKPVSVSPGNGLPFLQNKKRGRVV